MAETFSQALEKSLAEMNIRASSEQLTMMERFKDYIVEENKKINLTSITDDVGMAVKHFADSLTLLKLKDIKKNMRFIDVGTGAGFPGIPLCIMLPDAEGVLVDSVGKKAAFVMRAITRLGLRNATAVAARVEDMAALDAHREKYDAAFVRGVAALSVSMEYCLPFVKKGGIFVAMKGPGVEAELDDGQAAAFILGGKITGAVKLVLPYEQGVRMLVTVGKLSPTPNRFPRKPGEANRRPITREGIYGLK